MTTDTATIEDRACRGQFVLRDILEYSASGSAHRIDRGRGLIQEVKILGSNSRNGGVYPVSAMAAAKPLYEGVRVNINHPDRSAPDSERAFEDWFGVLENVRQTSDGLYGDLAYLTSHPLAGQICEAAERFPGSFGLSHNAQVREGTQEGQVVYESIHRVRSVDIVCKPATTRGIFESEKLSMSTGTSGHATFDAAQAASPADASSQYPADATQSPPQETAPQWEAFTSRIRQLYEGDDRATAAMQAIQLVSSLFLGEGSGELIGSEMEGSLGQRCAGSAGNAPGRTLPIGIESIATTVLVPASHRYSDNTREQARNMLESTGLAPDQSRINALAALASPSDRQALLAVWLASAGAPTSWANRPRSGPASVLEGAASTARPTGAAAWADPRDVARALLSR